MVSLTTVLNIWVNANCDLCHHDCVDIQEFYVHTLGDEYKPGYQKTVETLQLANQWEGYNAPIPANAPQDVKEQQPPLQQEDNTTKVTVSDYLSFILNHSLPNTESFCVYILQRDSGSLMT